MEPERESETDLRLFYYLLISFFKMTNLYS